MNQRLYIILTLLIGLQLSLCPGIQAYDYPLENPFAATVIGTPPDFRADLPTDIPIEDLEVEVFPDRPIPDVLWFGETLRYSLVAQDDEAPLIFVIAGTGAAYNSDKMLAFQKIFYQAGFHVVSLSSPTHANFIVSASSTGMPGHLQMDSQDLYHVMQVIWEDLQYEVQVTKFYLTGYSLGAAQSAFISKLDDENRKFKFEKVLLINPPVSLYSSAMILDKMLEQIPGGVKNFPAFFDQVFHAFSEMYREGDAVNFSGDFLYQAYQHRSPSDSVLAALIGVSFRLSSANMVFTSDVYTNAGYIKPKNLELSTTDSMTDYFKVSARVSFLEFFKDMFSPFFRNQLPTLSEQDLIESLSLRSLEDYLRGANKIGVVHNADDVILAPGELQYLEEIFGPRARIYPHGGHCGNLTYRENVKDLVTFFLTSPGTFLETEERSVAQVSAALKPLSRHAGIRPDRTALSGRNMQETQLPNDRLGEDLDARIARLDGKIQDLLEQNRAMQNESAVLTATLRSQAGSNQKEQAGDLGTDIIPPQMRVEEMINPETKYPIDIYDPLEGFNRRMYKFNAKFDEYVFLPVVHGYEAVTPDFVEDRISNFFLNITDIRNFLNALLQFKIHTFGISTARFLINSTLGIGGLWDPATGMGFLKQTEDFGQTLGYYGLGPGPYIVLPIFGPSSLRDTTGFAVDSAARYYYLYVPLDFDNHTERGMAYSLVNSIDTRHQFKFRYYQTGSPFEYDLVRFLYDKFRILQIEK